MHSRVVREQWIRGKYERQEFINVNLQKFRCKEMEGMMWKKLKDKQNFMERKFVLSEDDYTLKYYNKSDVSGIPKSDHKRALLRFGKMMYLTFKLKKN